MMGAGFHGGMFWRREQKGPTRVSRELLLRVVSQFGPYRKQGALALVVIAFSAGVGLVSPLLIRAIIDQAIPSRDFSLLAVLSLGMVITPAFGGLLGVLQSYLNAQISQRVMFDLRNKLYEHVQGLSLRFFTTVKTGEIMSRLNNDVSGINRVVNETMAQSVMQVLTLLSTIALMVSMEWRLALSSLVMVPLALAAARPVGNRRFDMQHVSQRFQADMTAIMQETLNISGFVLMKSFGREAYERTRFSAKNRELMNIQISVSMLGRWFRMLLQVLEAAGPAVVFLFGGYLVLNGEMSLGTIIAFVALLARLYGPLSQLANTQLEVMGALALFERIFEYLDMKPDITDKPGAAPLPSPVRGRVAFRDVTFEYTPGRPALSHVSFEAEPGQLVALVGPSGAGKTTTTYLIPRFYDVTDGRIEIDGQDVRNVTVASLRDGMGIVTQETYLFNTTIEDNLRYARPDAMHEEIEAACRAARLEDLIAQMPDGLHTVVGERGYRLSGGEKQRLAIARVLLKDPRILILDEATSSLDSQTEALIQAALGPLMEGRTTLAIAHRLSTVLAADKLVVLDQGRLVEMGTHRELLARGGLYAELFEIQFKPQLTEALKAPANGQPTNGPAVPLVASRGAVG
ncbi:MAG: transporter [Chloroflexi bacterium]|nr:transporter [Chloroflexota bacterium]